MGRIPSILLDPIARKDLVLTHPENPEAPDQSKVCAVDRVGGQMCEAPDFVVHDQPAPDLRRVDSHPDHWYPLAWSWELKPGKTYATHFAGTPIVLVRPTEGPVFALEDRCAHRQVPLSKGVVAGCMLRCCYHGWAYDSSGICVDVPYLGKGKLPNGVRSYPCAERDGLILIWPGDRQAVKGLGPLGAAENKSFKTRRFGKRVHCHYTFMHENLMDMNHQFLHRRQMGQIAPRYLGRRIGGDWLEVDYSFARTGGNQPLGEAAIVGRRRGVSKAPKDLMTIRTEYPYQTLRIWTSDDEPVMHLWIAYTPVDAEQKSNRTFGLLSVRRPKIPVLLDLAWPALIWFTDRIFAEDREIVEMEQAAYDRQGADWNQEVFPAIRDLRGLLTANGRPATPTDIFDHHGQQAMPRRVTPAMASGCVPDTNHCFGRVEMGLSAIRRTGG